MSYSTIIADPPWPDQGRGPIWNSNGASRPVPYPTMTIEQICALNVKSLASKNAHLYCWVANRYIPDVYEVVKAWGFKPSCLLTWCKAEMGIGLGGTYVQTSEHLLFARRGTLPALRRIPRTWFEWKRGRHSQKPDASYELIESVSPGPYLELFARRTRPGWAVWGNEVESTITLNTAVPQA